jgi:alkanesulfonate monooxygenase SsuD/methylene tetrahydromethanopterin reductase-like flavin-dependent oxidoreductase (luciferase family)
MTRGTDLGSGMVRLGVVVLPEFSWSEARLIWRDVEAMGFAHGWTYDHLAWRDLRDGPWFGAVPFLTAAALATSRLRLGPLVSSPNFRHPVAFARDVIGLDDISGGRLELGIGAGGQGWDATVLGQDPLSPTERVDRYREFVEVLDRLLVDGSLDYTGQFYSADGARSHPGSRQGPRVPFVLAGAGRRALEIVARFGHTWVTTGPAGPNAELGTEEGPVSIAAQLRMLEDSCRRLGRDPGELSRMVLLGPVLDQGLRSVQEFADTLGAYEAVGVTDVVVHWPRPSQPYLADRAGFEAAVLPYLGGQP